MDTPSPSKPSLAPASKCGWSRWPWTPAYPCWHPGVAGGRCEVHARLPEPAPCAHVWEFQFRELVDLEDQLIPEERWWCQECGEMRYEPPSAENR